MRGENISLFEKTIPNHPIPHKVLRRKLSREKFISPLSTHKMSNTTHNNNNNDNTTIIINNNNNNNNNNTRTNGTQACAACKYQRRKCASDCLLAPYFPHHLHHRFLNAHKLFGVSNITKIIRPLSQADKDVAMNTIMYESDARAADPVGGCYRIIRNLQRQVDFLCAELDLVLQQLAICRAAAAADTVSLICDPDPQTQPQPVGAESEDVTIHCDDMINNNVENHACNAYKAIEEGDEHDGVTNQCDNMINNNPEDQIYLQDRVLDGNNEEEDGGIGEYFLEEADVNNNGNVILSLQDMEAPWDMQNALAYSLHGNGGFLIECKDLKPSVVDIGDERLRLKYCNDETQIFDHSDEAISKDNKVMLQEETASCVSKDEKPIVREDLLTIEDAQGLI